MLVFNVVVAAIIIVMMVIGVTLHTVSEKCHRTQNWGIANVVDEMLMYGLVLILFLSLVLSCSVLYTHGKALLS